MGIWVVPVGSSQLFWGVVGFVVCYRHFRADETVVVLVWGSLLVLWLVVELVDGRCG